MLSQPSIRDRLASSNLISRSATGEATTVMEYSSESSTPRFTKNITLKPESQILTPSSSSTATLADKGASNNGNSPPAWLHVFPEGQIYQHPQLQMRYFKWGIARYILELAQPPIILPMFFSGMQNVMHEKRSFPRFLPRPGKRITITFGEAVPLNRWDQVRERWRRIRETCAEIGGEEGARLLREGQEAVQLRVEVALMVREEVEKLRVRCGYPPAEPESALAETFKNKHTYLHEFEADTKKHINS
ncbi:Tafazzin [Arthrobotrys entomopaga]|nr:Tafazzin [Arthrobotrys entomopaga]